MRSTRQPRTTSQRPNPKHRSNPINPISQTSSSNRCLPLPYPPSSPPSHKIRSHLRPP
uniref:AT3g27750/MGF10_15 n=1 Tax=Arabidopsis thaliana TaxID=3702 RepID=Q94JS2_ARATH|nr:AT3g27750/MGF10_15 [Arabidopsis thaliana]